MTTFRETSGGGVLLCKSEGFYTIDGTTITAIYLDRITLLSLVEYAKLIANGQIEGGNHDYSPNSNKRRSNSEH